MLFIFPLAFFVIFSLARCQHDIFSLFYDMRAMPPAYAAIEHMRYAARMPATARFSCFCCYAAPYATLMFAAMMAP